MNDKITFIIASYNDEGINTTIASITKQISRDDQIIVVDGKSSDNTVQVASEALQGVTNSIVFSEIDTGIYDAWNKALAKASGSWIAFLGCGDLLRTEYRNEMSGVISAHPSVNLIHHKAQFYHHQKGEFSKGAVYGRPLDKVEFARRMRICHVGALHKKTLFNSFGFSTDYQCVSDYHFLLRQQSCLNPHFIDKVLVDMESGGISSSPILPYREERRMKSILGGYNYVTLWFRFLSSVIKSSVFKIYDSIR